MQYEKLKGILRDHTLARLLREEATRIINDPRLNQIFFFTRKSLFVARRKDVKYWWLLQIHGTE